MEKKYYDLIITLIKQHKKFAEYEAILEDIANDVYEHSKVVLDSVTNEEVITAYLAKVISTSMITVPKKLNFNTKTRHRIILPVMPETQGQQETVSLDIEKEEGLETISSDEQEPKVTEQEILSIDDLIQDDDGLLNNVPTDFAETAVDIVEDSPELLNKNDNQEFDNYESVDFVEGDSFEVDIKSVADEDILTLKSNVENSSEQKESFVEEISVNNTTDVDKNLVDMMINGVPDAVDPKIESEFPDETELLQEQGNEVESVLEIIDTIEPQEELIQETSSEESIQKTDVFQEPEEIVESLLQQSETFQELTNSENFVDSIDAVESNDTIESLEVDEPAELIEEIESVDPIEDFSVEDISQEIKDAVTLDLDNSTPEFEIEKIAEIVHLDAIDTENIIALEEDTNEAYILESGDDVTTIESISENFSDLCYDNFYFEPQKEDVDEEEILSYLKDINEKHPGKRILEICDLKFKQELSVSEIVEKTGFTQDEVLSILNEIVDTVKD